MALDRTKVSLQILANTLAPSRTASYKDSKSVAIASAARFVSPPEIPSASGLGPLAFTSCGSRFTHLFVINERQLLMS